MVKRLNPGKKIRRGWALVAVAALALPQGALAGDQDWVGTAGGGDGTSFSDPLNWLSGGVPALGDTLYFGTGAASVALPGGAYDRLLVDQGGPFTFSGAMDLTGSDSSVPSLRVNRADTVFDGLSLTGVTGRVGDQLAGDLLLDNASNVSFSDRLYIGWDGVGRVDVVGGSTLEATGVIFVGLGTGTGDGTMIVSGPGSAVNVNPVYVSGYPHADLYVGSNRSRGPSNCSMGRAYRPGVSFSGGLMVRTPTC